jgi:hypothetical protein
LAGTSAPDLSSEISQGRIFLGGGGGAGHGNNAGLIGESGMNGGGIFLLLADTLVSNGGLILADGNSAIVRAEGEGGGAGGAGGTVVLISNTVSGNLSISCQGGKGTSVDNIGSGNCSGPAGGGGGGAILYSTSSKPGGILANLDGGANGVITSSAQSGCNVGNKNGATSGGNGGEVLNYNITDQSVERPPTSSQITACNKYFSPSGKYVWTQSGNYIDTTLNVAGCDSILDISLTIVPVDTSVQQEGNTLTSLATGVNHQWINCDTKLPIAGETQQNYTPTQNGNYAVVVGKNGCTDTSACKSVTTLSLTSLTKDLMVNVFPNPSNGIFHVVLNRELSNGYVQIMDLTGKEILVLPVEERREMKLELESHGVFLLQLYTDQELVHRELIISK